MHEILTNNESYCITIEIQFVSRVISTLLYYLFNTKVRAPFEKPAKYEIQNNIWFLNARKLYHEGSTCEKMVYHIQENRGFLMKTVLDDTAL